MVAFLVIIFFFVVAPVFVFLLFVFILIRPLTKENIGGHGAIRGIRIKVFWIHSVHAQWYASPPLGNDRVQWAG